MTTHDHRTIDEAGQCPDCRADTIALMSDDPYGFLLLFARPGAHDVEAIAAVRTAAPDMAVETAWATGCNAGDDYGVGTMGPFDPADLPADLVPWFQLVTGPDATVVVECLTSPEAIAIVDAFRASLRGHGDGCEECGVPLNVNPN